MDMCPDPSETLPADDTGTETLRRFRYQALITLPFCLSCALGNEILAVIPEHMEDIALRYANSWRFLQVKSRNPETGLWTLNRLIGDGGALRSLYRTHQRTLAVQASLEVVLEGAYSPSNPIHHLRPGEDHSHPQLVGPVASALEIEEADAISFLARVVLAPRPAYRDEAEALAQQLLHQQAPNLPHDLVSDIYVRLVGRIEDAMRAEPIGPEWPSYVTHPSDAPDEYAQRIAAKTLNRGILRETISPIQAAPRVLLRRIGDAQVPVSSLERKMIVGGADKQLIADARSLRMNAVEHLERRMASEMFAEDERIEDLRERLLIHANSRYSLHSGAESPANQIWGDLMNHYATHAASIDPDRILDQDSLLLLGKLCDMSDECAFDWGSPDE